MLSQTRSVQLGCALILLLVICGLYYASQSLVTFHFARLRANPSSLANSDVAVHFKPTKNTSYIVCAILKEEDLYVEEWIQYNMYLGFQTFELYDNSENGSAVLSTLAHKYWPAIQLHNVSGEGRQKFVYDLCAEKYANRSAYGAFLDCDEFIVLRNHTSIGDFLTNVAPNGESVALNWIRFGSNGHLKYENAPVLSRFTNRSIEPSVHIKSIAFMPGVREMTVHVPLLKPGYHLIDAHGRIYQFTAEELPPSEDVAAIHHYFTKTYEEFRQKRLRGYGQNWQNNAKYHTSGGEATMKTEFRRSENYTNAIRDTRALDFFMKHHKMQEMKMIQTHDSNTTFL